MNAVIIICFPGPVATFIAALSLLTFSIFSLDRDFSISITEDIEGFEVELGGGLEIGGRGRVGGERGERDQRDIIVVG